MKISKLIPKHSLSAIANYILLVTCCILLVACCSPVLAKIGQMDSDTYTVQMPNVNMTSGNKDSQNYKVGDTVGQTFQGLFDSDGYIIKAGFQYLHTLFAFSFSISDVSIDFGSLGIGSPKILNNQLAVSAPGAGGYQIIAYEKHPLRLLSGSDEIPDTLCNGGAQECDESQAQPWTGTNNYGFGFNISSDTQPGDIASDFLDTSYYRQFANASKRPTPEEAQIIMSSPIASRSAQATVRYKVNIDALQSAGDYQTELVFIAVPSY